MPIWYAILQMFFSQWKKIHISTSFRLDQLLISIFSAVLKEKVNWPANFSGLFCPKSGLIYSKMWWFFGSCGWSLSPGCSLHCEHFLENTTIPSFCYGIVWIFGSSCQEIQICECTLNCFCQFVPTRPFPIFKLLCGILLRKNSSLKKISKFKFVVGE